MCQRGVWTSDTSVGSDLAVVQVVQARIRVSRVFKALQVPAATLLDVLTNFGSKADRQIR